MAVTASTAGGDPVRHRGTPSPALLLGGVIALALLMRYLVLNGNGWVQDDNGYLVLAQQQGFGPHWLFSVISTHWEPAVRAIYSIQNHLMPFDYRWGLLLLLVIVGAGAFVFERIMRLLVGGTWSPVLAAGYLAFSVFLTEPLQWWTSGIEALPAMLGQLVCVYAFLRYQAGLRRRWIVVAAAALAIGLLFYEHAVFTLVYLALLRVLLLTGERIDLRAIRAAIWRERWMWGALIAVAAAWLAAFAAAGGPGGHGSAPARAWLEFWRVLWVQTIAPATVGVSFRTSPFGTISSSSMAVAIALQVALVALVLVSVWRRPSAWRAWLMFAICVIANGIPIGLDRLPVLGPGVASHLRYSLDFAWLTPLLVGLAFSRPQRAIRPRMAVAAAIAGGAAYIVLCALSAVRLQDDWPGPAARRWESNVQRLGRPAAPGRPVVLANALAPDAIATYAGPPSQNNLAAILPHYVSSGVRIDGPLIGPLVTLDQEGRAHPARVGPAIVTLPAPHAACTGAATAGPRVTWPIATRPPAGDGYYLWFRYRASRRATAQLLVDEGLGPLPSPSPYLQLVPGRHAALGWLGVGAPRRLALSIPSSGVCVSGAEIVTLARAA